MSRGQARRAAWRSEARLASERVDAIVVDPAVGGAADGGLDWLHERAKGAPLPLLEDGDDGHAGAVRVELERGNGGVVIRVEDTGPGIAAENLDRIFESFWQVDTASRSADGGTGLGLSVVRRLVELLGGEIAVESTVGAGSTFTVTPPPPPPPPPPA